MVKMSLVVVEVVHLPVPTLGGQSMNAQRLLMLANAWLQRRAAGHGDTLVLMGVGTCTDDEFRAMVSPFGLSAAVVAVVDASDDHVVEDLGASVGGFLDEYLPRKHPGAIPLCVLPKPFSGIGYPDDAWWLGIECLEADAGQWSETLAVLLPPPFHLQAASWEAVLAGVADLESEGGPLQQLEAGLAVASLARWLNGFSAAAGDSFFDFDYGEAVTACGLDPFMIGFEASSHHREDIEAEMDSGDTSDLTRFAVRELLTSGRYLDTDAIRSCFGSAATLFYSVHASIWPKRDQPAGDACEALTSPSGDEMGEIDGPWRFVANDDWSDIDDSL